MSFDSLFQSDWFQWGILPLLIFVARISDVSLMTLRIVFSAQGRRSLAPVVGFFEVLIWILAIGQIMRNLTNPLTYLAYAAGFAAGNYIGLFIEQKLAIGTVAVRIFLKQDSDRLMELLKEKGFGVTKLPAMGTQGSIDILYTLIPRRHLRQVEELIHQI
ncbi:MAG: DUF5698 domain-containing protein, partial [Anaerolineales bacterium]|nr:DUF5698 domain-containing protein [Anaerolineales bacterium]MDW8446260.1 DUF5698 domain-containing protein [Anaerolineales bacterium]